MNLLISWAVLAVSLFAAAWILPGMKIRGGVFGYLAVSAVYGIVSLLLGWAIYLAIGFGTLGVGFAVAFLTRWLVGAILLKLTDLLSDRLSIKGFGTALWASAIVSGVGTAAEVVLELAR
ncbi:MAG: phage holin family protein [Sandaracinaceae bacterium]|nr:phage holin family protein [Sandaracinaceae bacterium]